MNFLVAGLSLSGLGCLFGECMLLKKKKNSFEICFRTCNRCFDKIKKKELSKAQNLNVPKCNFTLTKNGILFPSVKFVSLDIATLSGEIGTTANAYSFL